MHTLYLSHCPVVRRGAGECTTSTSYTLRSVLYPLVILEHVLQAVERPLTRTLALLRFLLRALLLLGLLVRADPSRVGHELVPVPAQHRRHHDPQGQRVRVAGRAVGQTTKERQAAALGLLC